MQKKLILVDDHRMILHGLTSYITRASSWNVVFSATSKAELLEKLEIHNDKTKIENKILNENELTLTTRSNKEDIKLYIAKQVKKNLVAITEAYRQNNIAAVTDAFKDDIEPQIHKTLKESFINNTIWEIISDRIKNGLD